MDRIIFSKSIDVDPVLQVEKFFNEIMAMYNLVEGVNYKYIHGLIQDMDNISFVIEFATLDETIIAHNSLAGRTIQMYNSNFSILGDVNDRELSLRLVKV